MKTTNTTAAAVRSIIETGDLGRRIEVKTMIPASHLQPFEEYARNHSLDIHQILQSEAFSQAEAMADDPFGSLEGMERDASGDESREIRLAFCEEGHAFLSRVSMLLRRPLPELIAGLIGLGSDILLDATARMSPDCADMDGWARRAEEFEALAALNAMPTRRGRPDAWAVMNITSKQGGGTDRSAAGTRLPVYLPAESVELLGDILDASGTGMTVDEYAENALAGEIRCTIDGTKGCNVVEILAGEFELFPEDHAAMREAILRSRAAKLAG
ncbi:MAG: hypothetical protein H7A48_13865 [Akkermansiaceae bacterium]|nr:hypothetical protein [Akkermansiaceae bacterium]MCP5547359.1 hypothetical protein [Akkermansiaceae bacterium]